LHSTESYESKKESEEEYVFGVDPDDYGVIDWKKIWTKMEVLG